MEFYDFPFSWEFHHPNWRIHFFQRGGSTTNQWTNKKGPTFLGYFCRTSSFGKINLNQKLDFCQVFKIHHVKVPLMIGFYRELYYLGYFGLLLPIAGKPPPRWEQLGPAWTRWSIIWKVAAKEAFCTFWLGNVLRATTVCTFSTSQLPKVVRTWCVLYILTWECASRHNGMQFLISHLASWLRTRRFSEPTFRPSGAPNHWKKIVFRDFPTFSRICIFFLLTLLSSNLSLLSASSLLCFSSVHIVGSLTSKLPSYIYIYIYLSWLWLVISHYSP